MSTGIYWNAEAVVRDRQAELRRRAHDSRHRPPSAPAPEAPARRPRRPAVARTTGHLLIRLGTRLAGADGRPTGGRLADSVC